MILESFTMHVMAIIEIFPPVSGLHVLIEFVMEFPNG